MRSVDKSHRCERLNALTVTHLAENNLWGQIFWGATQCPGPPLYTFGKAKICHLTEKKKAMNGWMRKRVAVTGRHTV